MNIPMSEPMILQVKANLESGIWTDQDLIDLNQDTAFFRNYEPFQINLPDINNKDL